jgi:GGDEF domain-containing protein
MNTGATIMWSLALGAIGAVLLARLGTAVLRPSRSQWHAVGYHLTVGLLVLLESGLAAQWPLLAPLARPAQVVAGPLCVGLSNGWIRLWLEAERRDRFMADSLLASAFLLPLAGVACLVLAPAQQLPAAAAIALVGAVLTLWSTLQAWSLGDRLAALMSAGCALMLPALAGLYAHAADDMFPVALTAAAAGCAALGNGLTGLALWRREQQAARAREDTLDATMDPVTRLETGATLVHKLVKSQQRRRRTGRPGMVLAVRLFGLQALATRFGQGAVHDLMLQVAARIQRQAGLVNPVARYWDQCFVVLVESIESPGCLRSLGLQMAAALREPLQVRGPALEIVDIKPDCGVGVVQLATGAEHEEDILHAVEELALVARGMGSRAATFDPAIGIPVPLEQAQLDEARGARRSEAAN